MGTLPEIAAAHFAAIMEKARGLRETLADADNALTDEQQFALWERADELTLELVRVILDSPATATIRLALAAPAGAA